MYYNINLSWKSIVKKIMTVSCGLCFFMFIIISIGRFGNDSGYEHSVIESLVNYYGQSFTNFSGIFLEFPEGLYPHNKGGIHFPIIPGTATSSLELNDIIYTDLSLNSFPTVIGTWIEDCGITWTIFITVIFSFLIKIVFSLKNYTIFTLIYFLMIIEFLYTSIFYFAEKIYIYKFLCIGVLIWLDNISLKKQFKCNN